MMSRNEALTILRSAASRYAEHLTMLDDVAAQCGQIKVHALEIQKIDQAVARMTRKSVEQKPIEMTFYSDGRIERG